MPRLPPQRRHFEATVRLDARPGREEPARRRSVCRHRQGAVDTRWAPHVHGHHALSTEDDRPDVPARGLVLRGAAPGSVHAEAGAPRRRGPREAVPRPRVLRRPRHDGLLDAEEPGSRREERAPRLFTINERKKISVAFEGNNKVSSSTLRDELTLLDARFVRRLRGRLQRGRDPALLPGGRLLLRPGRMAPRAPVRRRGAHRLHD